MSLFVIKYIDIFVEKSYKSVDKLQRNMIIDITDGTDWLIERLEAYPCY